MNSSSDQIEQINLSSQSNQAAAETDSESTRQAAQQAASADEDQTKTTSNQIAVDEANQISQNQNFNGENGLTVNPIAFSKDKADMNKKSKKITLIISLMALIAGVSTGFGVHRLQSQHSGVETEPTQRVAGDQVKAGDVFGLQEEEIFKDTAIGYLEAGGINGEGSHKLLRPGGKSQTVYLTSTATDLDQLVGMEVKVWGETYRGQQAGWLMDVGKVEVLEVEGEVPFEEEM